MVKLLVEIACGDGHFAKRVVGMLCFPGGELSAPLRKPLDVQQAKAGGKFRHLGERSVLQLPAAAGRRQNGGEQEKNRDYEDSPAHQSDSFFQKRPGKNRGLWPMAARYSGFAMSTPSSGRMRLVKGE